MSQNKWINETKKYAKQTNQSYGEALEDKNHRISYHSNQCDPNKMYRGGTLLPLNHPAMNSQLPLMDHSYRTPANVKAYNDAIEKQKDNNIDRLKHLRKM